MPMRDESRLSAGRSVNSDGAADDGLDDDGESEEDIGELKQEALRLLVGTISWV